MNNREMYRYLYYLKMGWSTYKFDMLYVAASFVERGDELQTESDKWAAEANELVERFNFNRADAYFDWAQEAQDSANYFYGVAFAMLQDY